jgi:hypothetical protein
MKYKSKEQKLTPEIDCDQTAMDLPPSLLAVFVVVKSFWLNVGVSEEYLRGFCHLFGNKASAHCHTYHLRIRRLAGLVVRGSE